MYFIFNLLFPLNNTKQFTDVCPNTLHCRYNLFHYSFLLPNIVSNAFILLLLFFLLCIYFSSTMNIQQVITITIELNIFRYILDTMHTHTRTLFSIE